MQLESITLTLNDQTRTFHSADGTWFNATEISHAFKLPLPSQWRNAHSRYYEQQGHIRKVNGGDRNANLHSGVWMTRTALHAWAYSVDVTFSHKVILAFEAAADGKLEEAQAIASSMSSIVKTDAGIYDDTITVREAISKLKHHGYISNRASMTSVFRTLELRNIIRKEAGKYYRLDDEMLTDSRRNHIRLRTEKLPDFAAWVNLNV